jgi:hypothetical protein
MHTMMMMMMMMMMIINKEEEEEEKEEDGGGGALPCRCGRSMYRVSVRALAVLQGCTLVSGRSSPDVSCVTRHQYRTQPETFTHNVVTPA